MQWLKLGPGNKATLLETRIETWLVRTKKITKLSGVLNALKYAATGDWNSGEWRGCADQAEVQIRVVCSHIAWDGQAVAPLVEEQADLVRRLSSRSSQLCDQLHVVGLVALADEAVEALVDERPHHAIGSG